MFPSEGFFGSIYVFNFMFAFLKSISEEASTHTNHENSGEMFSNPPINPSLSVDNLSDALSIYTCTMSTKIQQIRERKDDTRRSFCCNPGFLKLVDIIISNISLITFQLHINKSLTNKNILKSYCRSVTKSQILVIIHLSLNAEKVWNCWKWDLKLRMFEHF